MSDEFKLARFKGLSDLTQDELKLLATFLSCRTYQDGEEILGDTAGSSLKLVFSGRVKIYRTFPNGGTFASFVEPNEMFGEVAFADQQGRTAHAVAVGETEIGKFDYHHFEVIKKQDPVFGMKFLLQLSKLLAGKYRALNQKLDAILGQIL